MNKTSPMRVSAALQTLIGQPLWRATRAVDMQIFDFGPRLHVSNRGRSRVLVGQYSLHVQCSWRIVGRQGIIVGYRDIRFPRKPRVSQTKGAIADRDRKLAALLRRLGGQSLKVKSVSVELAAAATIALGSGYVLQLFPDTSKQHDEYVEYWRLIVRHAPDQTSHFVVTADGIDKIH